MTETIVLLNENYWLTDDWKLIRDRPDWKNVADANVKLRDNVYVGEVMLEDKDVMGVSWPKLRWTYL